MKTIRLSSSDINKINRYIKTNKELVEIISKKLKESDTSLNKEFEISLDNEEMEKLLDYFSDLIVKIGFDENYNISIKGEEIEDLIDLFSIYYE